MAEDIEKDKWEFVEKRLVKKEQQFPQPTSNPLTAPLAGDVPQPQGVIEKFKVNKIERDQRIKMLTEKTTAQLEVYKHYVKGQIAVATQQIDLHVETRLMEIETLYLASLRDIGIGNYDDRQRALQALVKRSAEQILQVNSMDVPVSMKEKLIDAAIKGMEQLFEKISSDEIRTPHKA